MEEQVLERRVQGGVAFLTIQREQALNALNVEVLQALTDAFTELQAEPDIRAVALRGAGEKGFVAGADIRVMSEASSEELRRFVQLGQNLMRQIEAFPLPVVALVHGFALGGGFELALACDLIVASAKARFGQPEIHLGLIPGFGGTQRLIQRAGLAVAKRLIYTGETLTAEQAFQQGLVDYLVPPEEFEQRGEEILFTLAARSPVALAAAKRALEAGVFAKSAGLRREEEEFVALFDTEDAHEGMSAFLEKRPPKFIGR